MNSKKAKKVRKFVDRMTNWKDAKYEYSTKPTEREHQVEYIMKAYKYTSRGAKDVSYSVPIKVGTLRLEENCGKKFYRKLKKVERVRF